MVMRVLKFVLPLVLLVVSGIALASEDSESILKAGKAIGAGAAIGGGLVGAGTGIGASVNGMLQGLARNPSLGGKLMTNMFIGVALSETALVFGLALGFFILLGAF